MPGLQTLHPVALVELDRRLRRTHSRLPDPIVRSWSELPVLELHAGTPWVAGPLEHDALTDRDGRTVLPAHVRADLRRLAADRPPFHRLAVAHELDPDGPVGPLLPALRVGPRPCTVEVARALVGSPPSRPAVRKAARLVTSVVSWARESAERAKDLVLDPIVFGVIGASPPVTDDVCLWYPLAAWRW